MKKKIIQSDPLRINEVDLTLVSEEAFSEGLRLAAAKTDPKNAKTFFETVIETIQQQNPDRVFTTAN